MDKISITIVAFHNYDDIKVAVRTIEDFTDKIIKKHIYIVDNGSTSSEGVGDFISFINSFDDVEYLDAGENLGFGKGHNYVLDKIDSEYHAIVNPDILLNEDAISKIIRFLDENSNIGMCIPKIVTEEGVLQPVYRKELTVFDMFIRLFCRSLFPKRVAEHTLQNNNYNEVFDVPFGQGSFLVLRTDLFLRLKGFDDGYFMYLEDADLCRRVNLISRLVYLPTASVIHKWERGSHKNITLFTYHIKSMKYYFTKWGYRWK